MDFFLESEDDEHEELMAEFEEENEDSDDNEEEEEDDEEEEEEEEASEEASREALDIPPPRRAPDSLLFSIQRQTAGFHLGAIHNHINQRVSFDKYFRPFGMAGIASRFIPSNPQKIQSNNFSHVRWKNLRQKNSTDIKFFFLFYV
jgi:hypothetical protein